MEIGAGENKEIVFHYHYKANLNKLFLGKNRYIDKWSQYKVCFPKFFAHYGVKCLSINRIDFRIDNYEHSWSDLFQFNNAVAIGIGTLPYWESPCYTEYQSINNFHNPRYGAMTSCYDRNEVNEGGLTKTRYELRSSCLSKSAYYDVSQLPDVWLLYWLPLFCRMISSKKIFQQIARDANELLSERWRKGEYDNFSEFVKRHRGYIFTSRQLTALALGLDKSRRTAHQTGYRHNLQYIDNADFRKYLAMFNGALWYFFGT